jgi:hypothetical protein
MALFWREQGPIAYEADPPDDTPEGYRRFADQLLGSDLGWCWRSQPGSTTLLSEHTCERLVEELDEVIDREEGHRRHIDLFATDREAAPRLLDPAVQVAEVRQFCCQEAGALRMIWVRITDQATPIVFVPHHSVPACQRLVEMWVRPGARNRPYHRLGTARLEAMWELDEGGEDGKR